MITENGNLLQEVSPSIHFFSEEIDFNLPDSDKISNWLISAIFNENHHLRNINFIFCNDNYLLQLNIQYLNHHSYTDIITFPYSTNPLEGDIFISIDRVKENAQTFQVEFHQELLRVVIHGVLHLLGYNDKTEAEKMVMREKENAYLEYFHG